VEGNLTEYFETRNGLKQGCVFSPLLFTLFLNDLSDVIGGGILCWAEADKFAVIF